MIDPTALAAWLQAQAVSVVHLTPPLGKLIETGARLGGIRLDALRYLFWGGEALGSALYGQIREIAPNACCVNFYGTTETPQAMAYHRIDPGADHSRIPWAKASMARSCWSWMTLTNWPGKGRLARSDPQPLSVPGVLGRYGPDPPTLCAQPLHPGRRRPVLPHR